MFCFVLCLIYHNTAFFVLFFYYFFFIFLLNSILFPEEFVQWGKKKHTKRINRAFLFV